MSLTTLVEVIPDLNSFFKFSGFLFLTIVSFYKLIFHFLKEKKIPDNDLFRFINKLSNYIFILALILIVLGASQKKTEPITDVPAAEEKSKTVRTGNIDAENIVDSDFNTGSQNNNKEISGNSETGDINVKNAKGSKFNTGNQKTTTNED